MRVACRLQPMQCSHCQRAEELSFRQAPVNEKGPTGATLCTNQGCVQTKPEDDIADSDILYVGAAVTYSTILIKVFVMLEHAAQTGARWLLKTDDDAYINVPQTVQVCRNRCGVCAV